MQFKVISHEMPYFQQDLNKFVSSKDVKVISIQYTTTVVEGSKGEGLRPKVTHSALIEYKSKDVL